MTIEIAIDTNDATEFAQYCNALGHDARIGTSSGNYVDGIATWCDESANEIMRGLWEGFCNS